MTNAGGSVLLTISTHQPGSLCYWSWNGHRGGGSWKLAAGSSNSHLYTPRTIGEKGLLSSQLRCEKSQGRTVIGQPLKHMPTHWTIRSRSRGCDWLSLDRGGRGSATAGSAIVHVVTGVGLVTQQQDITAQVGPTWPRLRCAGEALQRCDSEWQQPGSLQVFIKAASAQNGPHLVAGTRRS